MHRSDAVGDQAFLHGSDQRDSAGYGGFKSQHSASFTRFGIKLFPVRCQESFIGRDHMFAVGQSPEDKAASRFQSSNEFHHDIDGRIVQHFGGF